MRRRWSRLLDFLASLGIPPPQFVIRVRGGVPTVSRGVVTGQFLAACGEVLRDHGISAGAIRGIRSGNAVSLRFSREIPEPVRQKVRNVWFSFR